MTQRITVLGQYRRPPRCEVDECDRVAPLDLGDETLAEYWAIHNEIVHGAVV